VRILVAQEQVEHTLVERIHFVVDVVALAVDRLVVEGTFVVVVEDILVVAVVVDTFVVVVDSHGIVGVVGAVDSHYRREES
jgi:hypothetical protein